MEWEQFVTHEESRYADGVERLPEEPGARQRQLVRIAMAAGAAGLGCLMLGRRAEAAGWLTRSAERYRESFAAAPPESWGRLIGAIKARLLAGDQAGAAADARWALEQGPAGSASAIGRYAAALAFLALGEDARAVEQAVALEADRDFPPAVAHALAALACGDADAYDRGLREVLASFEAREAYLEDAPVADTVLVLDALARPRGLAVEPRSPLLPGADASTRF